VKRRRADPEGFAIDGDGQRGLTVRAVGESGSRNKIIEAGRAPLSAGTAVDKQLVMTSVVYPPATREIGERRRKLAPEIHQAFDAFSQQVFADGALPEKTKQLIAVAVAHVTQCPYCIRGHTKLAHRAGARDAEIMEAICVAAEMRAGGAFAHSTVALHALAGEHEWRP